MCPSTDTGGRVPRGQRALQQGGDVRLRGPDGLPGQRLCVCPSPLPGGLQAARRGPED